MHHEFCENQSSNTTLREFGKTQWTNKQTSKNSKNQEENLENQKSEITATKSN